MENAQVLFDSGEGISRKKRYPPSLDPSYFLVDERSFIDLVTFTGNLSHLINYYNKENKYAGRWYEWLSKNSAIILIAISNTNLEGSVKSFKEAADKANTTTNLETKTELLKKLVQITLSLPLYVDYWYSNLSLTEKQDFIIAELKSAMEGTLSIALSSLLYIGKEASLVSIDQQLIDDTIEFSDFWQIDEGSSAVLPLNSKGVTWIDDVMPEIKSIFFTFHDTLLYIIGQVRTNIEKLLMENNDHSPDFALFMTFLKLYRHAQTQVNTFTERHLDLYYYDVLKQKEAESEPDQVHIYFELTPGISSALLPQGSYLNAGKTSSGHPILFATDHDFITNQCMIASLKSVFVSRNNNVYLGLPLSKNCVVNIYSSSNILEEPGPRSAFGAEQLGIAARDRTMEYAQIGFAIASPELIVTGGHREITITIKCNEEEWNKSITLFNEAASARNTDMDSMIIYLFNKGTTISVSTQKGWMFIRNYKVVLQNSALKITFKLADSFPSIQSYDRKIHDGDFDNGWPVLQLLLKHEAPAFLYSFIYNLKIKDIIITARVTGVQTLDLLNELGPLNIDKPFHPFGPAPARGSHLLIGNHEAFQKHLTHLSIKLTWNDIPDQGFSEYFKEYPVKITNDSFQIRSAILCNGDWTPVENAQPLTSLFQSGPTDAFAEKTTIIDLTSLVALKTPVTAGVPSKLQYTTTTTWGFVKLELSNPDTAFGHGIYPSLLTEAMIQKSKSKKQVDIPNAPFTPVLRDISLNYDSHWGMQTAFLREKTQPTLHFYHLHPFGVHRFTKNEHIVGLSLLPEYEHEGNLYIGFSVLQLSNVLTLFFQMDEGSKKKAYTSEAPQWSYLADNKWHPFPKDYLLSDTTDSFNQSGIITLSLPSRINTTNTLLQEGLYWIRVSLKDVASACKLVDLKPNAVRTTWFKTPETLEREIVHLPPNSISKTVETFPFIKKVVQPFHGFGGRKKETKQELYIRVSESLRHKNRALTSWDYERLILQHFPWVYKVHCYAATTAREANINKPGNILVVVIPEVKEDEQLAILRPKSNISRLREIRSFLKELAPPFVEMEVINPLYERIKVICKVKISDGYDTGLYIKTLNKDIIRFLSPWLFDDTVEIKMGGDLSRADLLGYLEGLQYIDFITGLSVVVTTLADGNFYLKDSASIIEDDQKLTARRPWSIMVSANNHMIEQVHQAKYQPPVKRSVISLGIEDDFIITD